MHYSSLYNELDHEVEVEVEQSLTPHPTQYHEGYYLPEAINNSLLAVNQTCTCDICCSPSPTSEYADSPLYGATSEGNILQLF